MKTKAREFAVRAHGSQTYGKYPYSAHLDAVAMLLEAAGFEEAVPVGYLHDVLEDTHVTHSELVESFGSVVANAVLFCSDEPGETRTERKANTAAKWKREIAAGGEHVELAVATKVADRLANVRACAAAGHSLIKRYRKEHASFREALYSPGKLEGFWAELAKLLA